MKYFRFLDPEHPDYDPGQETLFAELCGSTFVSLLLLLVSRLWLCFFLLTIGLLILLALAVIASYFSQHLH